MTIGANESGILTVPTIHRNDENETCPLVAVSKWARWAGSGQPRGGYLARLVRRQGASSCRTVDLTCEIVGVYQCQPTMFQCLLLGLLHRFERAPVSAAPAGTY